MRKLALLAAALLMSTTLAGAAQAEHPGYGSGSGGYGQGYGGGNGQGYGNPQHGGQQQYQDEDQDDHGYRDNDRSGGRGYGHDGWSNGGYGDNRRGEFGFGYSQQLYSGWYPGWRNSWWDGRHVMPRHVLARKLARQGFYDVRPAGFTHRGLIRVYAVNGYRRPVVLAVDPYTARVLRVRFA
jgi:hypothetical protein